MYTEANLPLNYRIERLTALVLAGQQAINWNPKTSTLHFFWLLMLPTLLLSTWFIFIALEQRTLQDFGLWVTIACLIVELPLLYVLDSPVLFENGFLDIPIQASIKQYIAPRPVLAGLHQEQWQWRDWQICYTRLLNPQSSVPVLFVHGFGGSIAHWRQNITELSSHHSVYALDLLGFGGSEKPDVPYSIHLWSDEVYDFWRTFIGVPVVLVGNSIGSVTCLATAAAHPDMVRGVAMISLPDTNSWRDQIPPVLAAILYRVHLALTSPLLLQPLFHLLRHPQILRRWAGMAYAGREAVTDELLEIFTLPTRDRGAARAFSAILRGMLSPQFSPCVRAILSRLHLPLLLLWGQCDRMVPAALAQRFGKCNPDLRLVELENAGHCAHDECPERVNRELLTWIQSQVLAVAPCP